MAVLRDVAALRLGHLQKIGADANEADCLRRGRAFIGHRHLLEVVVIDAKQKSTSNENRDQSTHNRSLALGRSACKSGAEDACARNQQNFYRSRDGPLARLPLARDRSSRLKTLPRTEE